MIEVDPVTWVYKGSAREDHCHSSHFCDRVQSQCGSSERVSRRIAEDREGNSSGPLGDGSLVLSGIGWSLLWSAKVVRRVSRSLFRTSPHLVTALVGLWCVEWSALSG